jgi:TonB family protein
MRISFVVAMGALLTIGTATALGQSNPEPNERQAPDGATVVVPTGSKDKPALVSPGVMAGLLLHKVDPAYPDDARKAKISGAVGLLATIDDQGKIEKLSVIYGSEQLRNAALSAVNQWTYKPYLLNGKPVFVKTQITVNFSITR